MTGSPCHFFPRQDSTTIRCPKRRWHVWITYPVLGGPETIGGASRFFCERVGPTHGQDTSQRLGHNTHQRSAFRLLHLSREPTVGGVTSLQAQFQIIVGQGFGEGGVSALGHSLLLGKIRRFFPSLRMTRRGGSVDRDGLSGSSGRTAVHDVQSYGLKRVSNKRLHEGHLLLCCQIAQNAVTLPRDVYWDLIAHGCCRRSRTRGVSEHVEVGEWQLFHHAPSLFEIGVGFAGEAGHHIGTDGRGGHGGADFFDLLAVM